MAMARSLNSLAHDVVELAELQTAMFRMEVGGWWGRLVLPGVLLISAIIFGLGCIPILLLSAAHGMTQAAGVPLPLSLLIVGGAVAAVAALMGWAGYRRLKACHSPFRESQRELSRNLRWIKSTLKHSAPPHQALRPD